MANNKKGSQIQVPGMSAERYEVLLRLIAAAGAIGAWWFSINFSVDGFRFELEGYDGLGWLLGAIVTITQLAYNHEGNKNMTIAVVGIAAYLYGIYTNVLGISLAQGNPGIVFDWGLLFPLFVGMFIEILPESFLVWALTGDSTLADFFDNLRSGVFDASQPRNQGQQSQNSAVNNPRRGQQQKSKPTYNPQNYRNDA